MTVKLFVMLCTVTAEVFLRSGDYRKEANIVGDDSQLTVVNTVPYILPTLFVKEEKQVVPLLKVRRKGTTITITTIRLTSQS